MPHLKAEKAGKIPENKFHNFIDVSNYQEFSDRYCVWPVSHFERDSYICFTQVEHTGDKKFTFEPDRRYLDLICQLHGSITHKLVNINRIKNTKKHQEEMLAIYREMLATRSHTGLQREVEKMLPEYFGFESCSVMYMEPNGTDLMKIRLNKDYVHRKKWFLPVEQS